MIQNLLLLILVAIGAKLWSDALRAREAALAACRRGCMAANVQLLDETVRLARLRLRRNENRRWYWERCYRFDFSVSGADRRRGHITFADRREIGFDLPLDGALHE